MPPYGRTGAWDKNAPIDLLQCMPFNGEVALQILGHFFSKRVLKTPLFIESVG